MVVGGGGVRGLCGWCNWGGVLWSELTAGGIGLCTPANVAQKLTGREKEVCKIMLKIYNTNVCKKKLL